MKSLRKLFSELPERQVPNYLYGKIVMSISRKQKNRALWEFSVSAAIFVLTFVLLIPVGSAVHNAMVLSGSYEYLSLIFSHFSEIVSSWEDFIFSLFESLPILWIAGLFALIFFLLGSLRFIARDIKILFLKHHF